MAIRISPSTRLNAMLFARAGTKARRSCVRASGSRKNNPNPRARATASDPMMAPVPAAVSARDGAAASGAAPAASGVATGPSEPPRRASKAASAEKFNERKPRTSAWIITTAPLTTGQRRTGCMSASAAILWRKTAIRPSGRRTATAIERGERIITPSRTAWPPKSTSS